MTETDPLTAIAEALATAVELAHRPEVAAALGPSTLAELTHAAAGYRQRFPSRWPSPQGQLPLN
ncbi:hypothetical protein O5F62_004763 [Salmonella enterica]|nr:hypothetical protein [Salmonella enterica]